MYKTVNEIHVILIKPTKYDKDGYPICFRREIIPSNSLAVLYTLTSHALHEPRFHGIKTVIKPFNSGVRTQNREIEGLFDEYPKKDVLLIVALVGVQTNQFPYACDMIARWREKGAKTVIGGFHVSGTVATQLHGISSFDPRRFKSGEAAPSPHKMPSEVQELIDKGTIVFCGEAEITWGHVLHDIFGGNEKTLYEGKSPDFALAPFPQYPDNFFRDIVSRIRPLDPSRGCTFACSFCSIINVVGRKMRSRDVSMTLRFVEESCREQNGYASLFFTDDNIARHPQWQKLFSGLKELREKGHRIKFIAEADLACGTIPGFLEALAEAGCSQVFMGVESLRQESLIGTKKGQNKVHTYQSTWRRINELGMRVHAGYILGFPADTADSIIEDIQELHNRGVHLASFFILTPIPGSEDHVRMLMKGVPMDPDLNAYDSFEPVCSHPIMTREKWKKTYDKAWRIFYSSKNMAKALRRLNTVEEKIFLLGNYILYRWSAIVEGIHPMMGGFMRYRRRTQMRPGFQPLSKWSFFCSEVWKYIRYGLFSVRELFVFQRVIRTSGLASALIGETNETVGRVCGIRDWARRTFGRRISNTWLSDFWLKYRNAGWALIWKWHLHFLAVPHMFTEFVYILKSIFILRKISRRLIQ